MRHLRAVWRSGRSELLGTGVVMTGWVTAVLLQGLHLHDDTFISLRYARNLLDGEGLVFNPGERVEGYTNFLWTLLLATLHRLGFDRVEGAAWLSAFFALCLVVFVYRFGVRSSTVSNRAWALVAPALLIVHPLFRAEAVGGLETMLFVWLVWVGFERVVAESRGESGAGALGAVLGIATLVRPEGVLYFVVLQGARFVLMRGRAWRGFWNAIGIYALLVAPHLVFRFVYYGDLVPNTFHAKVTWNLDQVRRGVVYVVRYGSDIVSLPVLVIALAGAFRGGVQAACLLVLGVHVLYVVGVGGDYAPTGRFLTLGLPFLAYLVQSALVDVSRALPARAHLRTVLPLAVVLLAAVWCWTAGNRLLANRKWPASSDRDLVARRFIGTWLRNALPPDAVVAVGTIGAIGYDSRLRILDTFGLTNREIGRMEVEWMGRASAGHEKGDADFVLRRAPQVILFDRAFVARRALGLQEFLNMARSPTEQLLVQDPRLYEAYGLRTVPSPVGVLHYLERIPDQP